MEVSLGGKSARQPQDLIGTAQFLDLELQCLKAFAFRRTRALPLAATSTVARPCNIYVDECRAAKLEPNGKFLTDLHFHNLRYEATLRLASIIPMHELAKITGHKEPRMLMRYFPTRDEDLAKRLLQLQQQLAQQACHETPLPSGLEATEATSTKARYFLLPR